MTDQQQSQVDIKTLIRNLHQEYGGQINALTERVAVLASINQQLTEERGELISTLNSLNGEVAVLRSAQADEEAPLHTDT